jgi:hypothetical protein
MLSWKGTGPMEDHNEGIDRQMATLLCFISYLVIDDKNIHISASLKNKNKPL